MRSLYAKLSLVLLGLLLALGAVVLVVSLTLSQRHVREIQQKLNRDLAEHIIADQLPMEGGRVRQEALEHIFHMLMVINPSIEVYLLDAEGTILAFSAPPGKVVRRRVSLAPIETFLTGGARLPILGDDPRDLAGRKIFSVSPIRERDRLYGYLYVVLASEEHDSVAQMVGSSYTMRLGLWTVVGSLLVALTGGVLLFARLTRRLRTLTREVAAFQAEEMPGGQAGEVPEEGDDLRRLSVAFGRMADRIREQLRQLRENDRLRREMVANISHDLRTPLTHLQGYLETLLMKGDTLPPGQRREHLEIAARQSRRLGELVADLFELATLDARQELPDREVFSAAELAQDVVQKFQLPAAEREVALQADISDGPGAVSGDLGLLERVLDNLIQNALQSSRRGDRITVSIRPVGDGVRIAVQDTGPGIDPGHLPHIFERFYRPTPSGAGPASGSGLGLAIAKRAVELHNSDLRCESPPGQGALFWFDLQASARP